MSGSGSDSIDGSPTISVSSQPQSTLASEPPSSAKSGSPTSKSSGVNAAGDDEGEATQFMVYYLLGGIYIRPVAFVSGYIGEQLASSKPYPLRRSCGQIQVVPYEPSSEAMRHDFDYVTESNIAPQNSSSLTITLQDEAKVNVCGELFGGYAFEAPSQIEFNGTLHLAYWTDDGLAEEALNTSSVVEVTEGTATLFVCDQKHLVLMYDSESKYTIGLLHDEGEQVAQDGSGSGKSAHVAKTLNRIASTAKPGQSSGGSGDRSQLPTSDANSGTKAADSQEQQASDSPSSSSPKSGSPGKGKVQLKRKAKSLSDVKWLEAKDKIKGSPSIAASVLSSIINWKNTFSSSKSSSSRSSKSASEKKTGKGTKQLQKRPANEPNVKLAKSKFTPSSHNLNSSLSRTKSASQSRRDSEDTKNAKTRAVRSPNRAQPVNVSKAKLDKKRPSSLPSIKSNQSSSLVQTRSMARYRSQMMNVKTELDQLLSEIEKSKDDSAADGKLKETMTRAVKDLQTLVESASGSTKQQLAQDLAELRDYSNKLSAEQLDKCGAKVAAIVKKLDDQLEVN